MTKPILGLMVLMCVPAPGGGASVGMLFNTLSSMLQGGAPDAALQRLIGMAALQQISGGPNGLSLDSINQLANSVHLGRPLCLMTEVDTQSLLGSSSSGIGGSSSGSSVFLEEGEGGWAVGEQLEQWMDEWLL